MAKKKRLLRFAWWNLHDFAHFDRTRISRPRWPTRAAHSAAKRGRVLGAFAELFGSDFPDLLAVCEVTREAAEDLLPRLPTGYELAVDPSAEGDDFRVAVFYRPAAGLTREPLLIPFGEADVPRGTRAMVPVHHTSAGHVIRFVFGHWPGLDEDTTATYRARLADLLRRNTHEFLYPAGPAARPARHVVILGDLNEEPTAPLFADQLPGGRDRATSRRRPHWRDADVRRVRLYNAAWKYLGEQAPHRGRAAGPEIAGTYFGPRLGWRAFDHLLVTGGLLGPDSPFLDEAETRIMWTSAMLDGGGRPTAFDPGRPGDGGVSDHLPLVGRIVLG